MGKQFAEKRASKRHSFEFLALEHRPDGEDHPQASRLLKCLDFSLGGVKIEGEPRYNRCRLTLSIPQDGTKLDADIETIYRQKGFFGAKFSNPSNELKQKLSWWSSADSEI